MKRHWNIPNAEIRESLNRALEVWEAAFDAIVEKSADGVIVVDRGGTICFANSAAESMLGSSTGSLLGKTFGIPVVPGKTSEIDLLKGGGLTRIAEMRTVETSWQGNAAYLATLRDVTERKKAEEQAREAVRRRDEFLAILSTNCAIRWLPYPTPPACSQAWILTARHSKRPTRSSNASAAR